MHRAAAEKMQVEVIDGLAAVGSGVDDEAVAAIKFFGAGHFADRPEQVAEQVGIAGGRLGVGADVLLRDYEYVRRAPAD